MEISNWRLSGRRERDSLEKRWKRVETRGWRQRAHQRREVLREKDKGTNQGGGKRGGRKHKEGKAER